MGTKTKHTHFGYGFYPGGDPRRFFPDHESCSPEEIAAHEAACAKAVADEAARSLDPQSGVLVDGTGKAIGFWDGGPFGIGTYEMDCDDPECPEALALVEGKQEASDG